MSMRCKDCGNVKEFLAEAVSHRIFTVGGEGEWLDSEDTDQDWVIYAKKGDDVTCARCDGENIEWTEDETGSEAT